MIGWLRAMLGTRCQQCGGEKPRWTHVCDICWEFFGAGRSSGDEW